MASCGAARVVRRGLNVILLQRNALSQKVRLMLSRPLSECSLRRFTDDTRQLWIIYFTHCCTFAFAQWFTSRLTIEIEMGYCRFFVLFDYDSIRSYVYNIVQLCRQQLRKIYEDIMRFVQYFMPNAQSATIAGILWHKYNKKSTIPDTQRGIESSKISS